jgi:hypothetical protein
MTRKHLQTKLILLAVAATLSCPVSAEDFEIIPKIEKKDAKNINREFAKSLAETKKADGQKPHPENFGARASGEAKALRDQTESKGIGAFSRNNNPGSEKRPSSVTPGAGNKASAARDSAPRGGRPDNMQGGHPQKDHPDKEKHKDKQKKEK